MKRYVVYGYQPPTERQIKDAMDVAGPGDSRSPSMVPVFRNVRAAK